MTICLIGDPHFANRKMFGGEAPDGVNRRLATITKTLKYIADELPAEVKTVVILGDITHEHGILTPPVQHQIISSLEALTYPDRRVYLLTGNHDLDANGLSILRGFTTPQVSVIERPMPMASATHGGFLFRAIPYGPHSETIAELEEIKKRGTDRMVLFMHHHFDGAEIGAHEYTPSGGLSPKHIPKRVEMVFTGHYHKCQVVDSRIFYVGVPLQHDFGETAYEPCYHLLTADKGKMTIKTFVVTPEVAPRFHIIPHNQKMEDLPTNMRCGSDYFRIDWPTDEPPEQARELAKNFSNVIINPVPVLAKVRSRVEEHLKMPEGERATLEGVMDAYTALNAKGERYEELLELGLEISRSVTDEV